jgi:hypothetical protein
MNILPVRFHRVIFVNMINQLARLEYSRNLPVKLRLFDFIVVIRSTFIKLDCGGGLMSGKRASAHPGWVLVDVLCCVIVAMTTVTCVTQSTDVMSRVALKNRDMRASVYDYMSLSDEMSVYAMTAGASEFVFGKWKGRKMKSGSPSGIAFADIAVSGDGAGAAGGETAIRMWNIPGRK